MKIAVWHNLPDGGAKRALYDHVRGLIRRGHTVEAWCPPTASQSYLPLQELTTEHVVPMGRNFSLQAGRLSRLLLRHRLTVERLKALDFHCRQCAEQINRGGFDLLFANTCTIMSAAPIGRYVKIPTVLYLQEPNRIFYEAPHLPLPALPRPQEAFRSPDYWKKVFKEFTEFRGARIQVREEQANARAFDVILVNSLYSRENVLRAYGVDARVCYLGVDLDKFTDHHLPRENFVVGVGAISPHKNIAFIIESLAKLPQPRPTLVWIGNGVSADYLAHLQALARTGGVECDFRVRISDQAIVEVLNRARLAVYSPRLEPFGFMPLEANACGLPVVAVAEGGVRETVVDGLNGLLVESEPEAMAAAIQRLLNDTEYAALLGRNGYKLVAEKWSMETAIDRLELRLRAVLAGASDRSAPVL